MGGAKIASLRAARYCTPDMLDDDDKEALEYENDIDEDDDETGLR